jgi:ribosomal protein S17
MPNREEAKKTVTVKIQTTVIKRIYTKSIIKEFLFSLVS